jgi:outer membrane immunogenic protein
MKVQIFASVATFCLTVSTAIAADLPVKSASTPAFALNDWSGFYLGAHGGYGWGDDPSTVKNNITVLPDSVVVPGTTISPTKSKGALGGFQAGYNWQYDSSWVLGLEIDLSRGDIKGSSSGSSSASITDLFGNPASGAVTDTRSDKFEMLGSARARAGYAVTSNVMIYATGGLGWTRVVQTNSNTQFSSAIFGAPQIVQFTSITTTPMWEFGWVAGAGGEARIGGSNWIARLEYLHYDFGTSAGTQNTVTSNVGLAAATGITGGRLTADVVRAGVSYKFGGGTNIARD